jgi:hypothetical protein
LPGTSPATLVDVAGRAVKLLLSGSNDLGALAPGVYFLRMAEPGAAVGRLVVTR